MTIAIANRIEADPFFLRQPGIVRLRLRETADNRAGALNKLTAGLAILEAGCGTEKLRFDNPPETRFDEEQDIYVAEAEVLLADDPARFP